MTLQIIEGKRARYFGLFVLFLVAGMLSVLFLMRSGNDVGAGLWFPIPIFLCFGLAFFAWQSLHYSRRIEISANGARIQVLRWRQATLDETVPLSDYKGLALQWHFAWPLWPRARLHLLLIHENPLFTIEIARESQRLSPEELKNLSKQLQKAWALSILADESS